MEKTEKLRRPGRKVKVVLLVVVVIAAAAAAAACFSDHKSNVGFTVLDEKSIPAEISRGVLPEYRSLERALACISDDKVYVVVTRGEKPASGYKVDISKMKLEKEEGKSTLVVYAEFTDPGGQSSMSQVLNYPVKVAVTDLERLPDEIELRIRYMEE